MQVSSFSIHLSNSVVLGNIQIFSTWKVGEKPLMDNNGAIKKEERILAALIRASFGGFDKECVHETFKRAVEIINLANKNYTSGSKILKTDSALVIFQLFLKAISGIRNIAETYRNEKKDKVAERLKEIAKEYLAEYTQLPDLEKILLSKQSSLRRRRGSKKEDGNNFGKKDGLKLQLQKLSPRHKKTYSGTMEKRLLDKVANHGSGDDVSVEVKALSKSPSTKENIKIESQDYRDSQPSFIVIKNKAVEDREDKIQNQTKKLSNEVLVLHQKEDPENHPIEHEKEKGSTHLDPIHKEKTSDRKVDEFDVTDDDDDDAVIVTPRKRGILYKIFCCGCRKGKHS